MFQDQGSSNPYISQKHHYYYHLFLATHRIWNCHKFTSPDVISHKETGYLAEPFNIKSLLNGMLWILKNVEENKNLSKKSRSRACLLWNPSEISYKYKTLYEKVIQNCN